MTGADGNAPPLCIAMGWMVREHLCLPDVRAVLRAVTCRNLWSRSCCRSPQPSRSSVAKRSDEARLDGFGDDRIKCRVPSCAEFYARFLIGYNKTRGTGGRAG